MLPHAFPLSMEFPILFDYLKCVFICFHSEVIYSMWFHTCFEKMAPFNSLEIWLSMFFPPFVIYYRVFHQPCIPYTSFFARINLNHYNMLVCFCVHVSLVRIHDSSLDLLYRSHYKDPLIFRQFQLIDWKMVLFTMLMIQPNVIWTMAILFMMLL